MGFILGVDQGSSKAAAVVGDYNGNIVGKGISGGACHVTDGIEFAMERVKEACLKVLA